MTTLKGVFPTTSELTSFSKNFLCKLVLLFVYTFSFFNFCSLLFSEQPKGKNFIRENVRNIRRISSHTKDDKSSEKSGCNSTGGDKKGKCISANSLFSRRSGSEQRVWSQPNYHHRQEKKGEKEKSQTVTKNNFDLIKSSNSNGKTRKSASLDRKSFVSRGIQTSFDCPLGKIQR